MQGLHVPDPIDVCMSKQILQYNKIYTIMRRKMSEIVQDLTHKNEQTTSDSNSVLTSCLLTYGLLENTPVMLKMM